MQNKDSANSLQTGDSVSPETEPAQLDTLQEFVKISHGTARHLKLMRQETLFTDGVVPARIKVLAAALWSVSARCEPCIRFYMRKALEYGATREEISEVLSVASVMGGCVGETWAIKAFSTGRGGLQSEACCES